MLNETVTNGNENEVMPLSSYFVGREVVNSRVKRYMNGKHKLLTEQMASKGLAATESHFVWYPKDYLETLIKEMEHYGANGIRVYFGEYANDPVEPAPGQLGLLLVLTQLKSDGKIHDILFEEQVDYQVRSNMARSRGLDFSQLPGEDGVPREFNAMLPCPPACLNHEPHFPEEEVS